MANAKYDEINTMEVATMLGVSKATVIYWCKKGYIRYSDVSEYRSSRPRFVFDIEDINKVSKLRDQYGPHWVDYVNLKDEEPVVEATDNTVYGITNPEEYIPDDTDETISYVKKI